MFIKELNIKGFRSLKDLTFKPGKLNVLIGPNGSGKSNLMRFLELISASTQKRLDKFILSNGGMESILWDGSSENVFWRLHFSSRPLASDRNININYTYEVDLARKGKTSNFEVRREVLSDADQNKIIVSKSNESYKYSDDIKTADDPYGRFLDEGIPTNETFLGYFIYAGYVSKLLHYIQNDLSNILIYHDIDFGKNSMIRQSTVARHEKIVEPNGQNLVAVLHTLYTEDKEFRTSLDRAMRAAFGDEYEELTFPPAADQRIQMRLRWRSLSKAQSAADLSDGTLRFLFLLTLLLNPQAPSVLVIDEPENGLHPSMLPIIAELANELSETSQIIFTTHSPQFLDAFEDEAPTTTVVSCSKGETILKTLEGSKLKAWLGEYSLGSLYKSGELEAM
jgi:predicted ATPase